MEPISATLEVKKYTLINDALSFSGVLLLCWSFYLWSKANNYLESAVYATGVVIEHKHPDNSKSGRPVVTFTAENNKEYTFTSNRGSYPLKHKIGETVTITHPKTRPNKAQIDGYPNIWSAPITIGITGIFCFIIGTYTNYRLSRTGKKTWK